MIRLFFIFFIFFFFSVRSTARMVSPLSLVPAAKLPKPRGPVAIKVSSGKGTLQIYWTGKWNWKKKKKVWKVWTPALNQTSPCQNWIGCHQRFTFLFSLGRCQFFFGIDMWKGESHGGDCSLRRKANFL